MTTFPTIHLNGTSAKSLLQDYCDAMLAIEKAQVALAKCSPNGRDYYPQGDEALRKAIKEHNRRAEKLREVWTEIEEIALYVSDHS